MKPRVVSLLAAIGLFWAAPASATPRFAIREGATCRSCHVNPSGGGMRNRYGRYVYGPTQLPAGYPGVVNLLAPLDVDVGNTLSFGGDARAAYIEQHPEVSEDQDPDIPKPEVVRTLFLMQADFYVAVTPFSGLTLYYDQGTYGSFEAIVLYELDFGSPTFSGYVKAGYYMPTYGLRLPNHRLFTRQEIGFGPRDKDMGAEIGAYLGPVLLQIGVVNGAGPDRKLDDNTSKGVVGRAELLLEAGALRLMLGGSVYYNTAGTRTQVRDTVVDTRTFQTRVSAHWGAALGRFAYLGEATIGIVRPGKLNTEDSKERSFRSFQELAVLLFRGLDLTLSYEFREPDFKSESGSAHRIGAGFEFFPLPYAEIKALYRHSFGSGPAEKAQDGFNEFIGMVHVFF